MLNYCDFGLKVTIFNDLDHGLAEFSLNFNLMRVNDFIV